MVVEVVITTSSQLQRSFASSVFKAVPSLVEDFVERVGSLAPDELNALDW